MTHPEPTIPVPPEHPDDLRAWADEFHVSGRLDDVIIGQTGQAGTFLFGRHGEELTYRQLLLERAAGPSRRSHDDGADWARVYLHRVATLTARARATQAWRETEAVEPDDEALAAFLARLRLWLSEVIAVREVAPLPPGLYEPVAVRVGQAPVPLLRYLERPLIAVEEREGVLAVDTALLLMGWNDGAPRWGLYAGERAMMGAPSLAQQERALTALIDFVRDPGAAGEHEVLSDLLRVPAWQYALGTLDESLARLAGGAPAATSKAASAPAEPGAERLAFRVVQLTSGALNIEPLLQKRTRGGGFTKGATLNWYQVPERPHLTAADRRAYLAYDDRFARHSNTWGGPLTAAQCFGVLRALTDHPGVHLAGEREGTRLDIRHGRLHLGFANHPDGSLAPQFQLLGLALSASEVAAALREDKFVIHLHRPIGAAPQVLLAEVEPQAAALVHALALAPARFPPEAHDALAARLEPLQELVDIALPSAWTQSIAAATDRLVARLELLASGAVQIRLCVRPVKLGPIFAPGEGPVLVLEGQGRDRHGVRRDHQKERQSGHALAARLSLNGGQEIEPWSWRVGEGDPALDLISALKDLVDEVIVEWADDQRLLALGSVGRRDLQMKVGDKKDWFFVEGGAKVAGETVPLADLLAAIRDGRRYVAVGARGFARIEETLREALARAEASLVDLHGTLHVSAVGSDPLMGLVEDEAQVLASAAFQAIRRKMREGETAPLSLPSALETALRPYQRAGVAWMARLSHWGAGAVLADEMGLGKTIQTLAILAHRAAQGPALVVAPTSVVANWVDEAARFTPELSVRLYRGPDRAAGLRALGPGDVVITSYTLATSDVEALAGVAFGTLVLDEAQAVKNAATERAKALRSLDTRWRLGLTGTPIENHIGELWSLFRVISPGLLGSWGQFRARYAVPIEKFGDDTRRKALTALLRPFVLRRTKADVAPELPARTTVVRSVRLSPEEHDLYEQLRRSTIQDLAAAKKDPDRDASSIRFVLLAALTRLRQLCCHPRLVYPNTRAGSAKAGYLVDLLGELREGGHKALVFSQFRSFLELLTPRLRQHGFRVLVLDGTTPAETRAQRIAAFQAGAADVFLISLKAGGFGLNLTAADTVIHLDPWWNPAVEDQATARAHRIGQRKPVTAIRLVARDTIEEAVLGLHAAKRALAAGVLEDTDVAAALGTDELLDLIRTGDAPRGAMGEGVALAEGD